MHSAEQGGYEVMVLSATEDRRLGDVALSMHEQVGIERVAHERGLAVLASFPDYWGEEHQLAESQVHDLIGELRRIEEVAVPPEVLVAAKKLLEIATIALKEKLPLLVVPD